MFNNIGLPWWLSERSERDRKTKRTAFDESLVMKLIACVALCYSAGNTSFKWTSPLWLCIHEQLSSMLSSL
jgi:hypothetical protein